MDSFKEFLGKDFDDCIGQALQYYDCPRENLEVEIVQDAKSGIFGIVGARKAKIRARRARLAETVASLFGAGEEDPAQSGFQPQKKSCLPAENTARQQLPQSAHSQNKQEKHYASPHKPSAPMPPMPANAEMTRIVQPQAISTNQAGAQARQRQELTTEPGSRQAKAVNERPAQDRTAKSGQTRLPPQKTETLQDRKQLRKPQAQAERDERAASSPADAGAKTLPSGQVSKMLATSPAPLPGMPEAEQAAKKAMLVQASDSRQRDVRSRQSEPEACQDQIVDLPVADDLEASAWPVRPIEDLDQELLREKTLEIVGALLKPIAGRETPMRIEPCRGGARAHVDWEEDAGLLIGREGQTLAAIQYLASRMLSRVMATALHVQVDIGNYRARQDDKLRELAKTLAERVRQAGRPFSTRPLSSYHRRVIHVFLQDYEDIQTRSVGEGPQKRVLIAPRRSCPQ